MTNLAAIESNYREIGDTTLQAVLPLLRDRGSPMVATAEATHKAASPHSAQWWAQTGFENQWATTGHVIQPEDHNPAALRPWVGDPTATKTGDVLDWKSRKKVGTIKVPPYALGAVRDSGGGMMLRFASDADCATEYKRRLSDPRYKDGVYNKARSLWQFLNIYCPPNDKPHPVTGVPNTDILDDYYATVVRLLKRFAETEGTVEQPPTGGDNVAVNLKAYTVQGAPRELYLPADVTVIFNYVKHPNVTNQRVRVPKTSTTYHDTGNPRTNAAAEMSWLAQGRPGGEAGGYNWISGTKRIYITGPFNWETWHAGVPAGNWYSLGGEHAFGGGEDWQGSLDTACWMHAAVLECYDFPMSAFYWHQKWYGKYCPGQIFNRGLQSWVIAKVTELRNIIRAHRDGKPIPPPEQEWADTVFPIMANGQPWDGKEDAVINGTKWEAQRVEGTVTADALNMRQWASTESLFTGPGYKRGDKVKLLGWVAGELVDGISEWWIDEKGHRLWAGGLDVEPKQDPEWPIPPENPPGMVAVNGHIYYPLHYDGNDPARQGELGREITIHRDGDLYKWANPASGVVGAVKAGDVKVFKYWTRGEPLELDFADGSVGQEDVYFAEDLHSGGRMWSGLSEERPD